MILWRNIENYPFFTFLIPTPDFPHFYYMLGGNLGSLLYGDVSVMYINQWDFKNALNLSVPYSDTQNFVVISLNPLMVNVHVVALLYNNVFKKCIWNGRLS